MITQYSTAKEYLANEVTMSRGTPADITAVGVYHDANPAVVPTVAQFTTVTKVVAGDALAEGTKTDVLSLVGPSAQVTLSAGTYQRWVLVQTASENIIRAVDMIQVV